jgi:DNA end-binding protein Ku
VKITKDMLDLAKHIVEQKSGHFQPEKFEDHYEAALAELLAAKKQKGQPISAPRRQPSGNRDQPNGCAAAELRLFRKARCISKDLQAPAKKASTKKRTAS